MNQNRFGSTEYTRGRANSGIVLRQERHALHWHMNVTLVIVSTFSSVTVSHVLEKPNK